MSTSCHTSALLVKTALFHLTCQSIDQVDNCDAQLVHRLVDESEKVIHSSNYRVEMSPQSQGLHLCRGNTRPYISSALWSSIAEVRVRQMRRRSALYHSSDQAPLVPDVCGARPFPFSCSASIHRRPSGLPQWATYAGGTAARGRRGCRLTWQRRRRRRLHRSIMVSVIAMPV